MNTLILKHTIQRRFFHRGVVHRFIHSEISKPNKPIAFAFDIDGVLLQGSTVLPEAKRALRILQGHNSKNTKIPYILITNGGGVSEEERCNKLSTQLGVKIDPFQLIQAHTILRGLPRQTEHRLRPYPHDPVLVLGGTKDNVRKIAEDYGFKSVHTSLDILAWNPSISPFHTLTEEDRRHIRKVDFSKVQFGTIMVFHDPRNWSLDIQIMIDILQSKNRSPGGTRGRPKDPIELIFCNPDLLWRSAFKHPRLGQGSFIRAFQAVYKEVTGEEHPYIQYGKPLKATFDFAESQLMKHIGIKFPHISELPRVYMIGDNPASDIAGANIVNWSSILVSTGVYDPNTETGRTLPPTHHPTHYVENVEDAVKWVLEREGYVF